jgi:pyruvate formate lyase activating enzyme
MKIAALVKTSLVDYPGRIAAVVFTQGCNLRCGYCHNQELLDIKAQRPLLNPADVFSFLERRKGLLEGVVITGGEPTLQTELQELLRPIKAMGYLIKLDSNGTAPAFIKTLIDSRLIDYVAMDVKAPPEQYGSICGRPVDVTVIAQSITLLRASKIAYEFRTTMAPGLDMDGLAKIRDWIGGTEHWFIQRYRAPVRSIGQTSVCHAGAAVDLERLQTMFPGCKLRGFEPLAKKRAEKSL